MALYRANNCLINAIAASAGVAVGFPRMVAIRFQTLEETDLDPAAFVTRKLVEVEEAGQEGWERPGIAQQTKAVRVAAVVDLRRAATRRPDKEQRMADVLPGSAAQVHGEAVSLTAGQQAPGPAALQIVPIAGLPIAGVVLAGLVAAVATNRLWALDFFHVVGGGLWTGIDLFLGFIVGPVMGRMSIPARAEFSRRFMPKMVLLMPTLVICTLAAGWQLARHVGYLSASYHYHSWVVASFIVVGVMAVVALGILEPANLAVLFEMKKPRPDGALIGKLMKRFVYTAGVTGAMQVATLIIMTRLASS